MKKLWVIIRKEYREVVKTKGFVVGTILTPLIMGAMMFLPGILAMRGDARTASVGIMEVDSHRLDSLVTLLTLDTLTNGKPRWDIEYVALPASDTAAVMALWTEESLDGQLDAFVVADSTIWSESRVSYFAVNTSRRTLLRDLRSAMTGFVVAERLRASGIDPDSGLALTRRVGMDVIKIGTKGQSKSSFLSDYFAGLIFSMILFMVIVGYGATLTRSIITERNSRIVEVLMSSVKAVHIMGGKIIGMGAASLTQVALWIIAGTLLSAGGMGMAYIGGASTIFTASFALWFTVFLILGFLFYSCLFAVIGAIAPTEQDAQQFMGPFTLSLLLPVIIEFAIVENPSALWVRLLSMIPPFSPSIMIMRLTFSPVPLWEPLLSVAILTLTTIGVAWLSGRVFRIGILMTGKRPTLPEIMKWMRYG